MCCCTLWLLQHFEKIPSILRNVKEGKTFYIMYLVCLPWCRSETSLIYCAPNPVNKSHETKVVLVKGACAFELHTKYGVCTT